MTRPLRIEFEGTFYHIISKGNEKSNIYRDTKDRKNFRYHEWGYKLKEVGDFVNLHYSTVSRIAKNKT